ncbi:MAG: hypothetical protein R2705_02805 [Ilumatobacteraceae bacterium]
MAPTIIVSVVEVAPNKAAAPIGPTACPSRTADTQAAEARCDAVPPRWRRPAAPGSPCRRRARR